MNCEQKLLNTDIGTCSKICRLSHISMAFMGSITYGSPKIHSGSYAKCVKGSNFRVKQNMSEQKFLGGIIFQAEKIIFQNLIIILEFDLRPSLVLSCNDIIYLFISIQYIHLQTCYYCM